MLLSNSYENIGCYATTDKVNTCASIVVDIQGEGVDNVSQSLLQVSVGKTPSQGMVKYLSAGTKSSHAVHI